MNGQLKDVIKELEDIRDTATYKSPDDNEATKRLSKIRSKVYAALKVLKKLDGIE